MKRETNSQTPAMPSQRFALRAAIIEAGFLRYNHFAKAIGINQAYVNRVLTGFMFPSGRVQRLMARELGLNLSELRRLL